MPDVKSEITRYLETGEWDSIFASWPGTVLERCRRGSDALLDALIREVHRRTRRVPAPPRLPVGDLEALARSRVEPMVRGLFPAQERETVLRVLGGSIVFVTPENVESVLREESCLSTSWDVANLYLGSIGAPLLGPEAPRIVGLSADRTCYVTLRCFEEPSPLADFIVHEAAHIFHNCKRATIGLLAKRRQEWLLDIAYAKRETFAYACEAWSRLLVLGRSRVTRERLLHDHAHPLSGEERVDYGEYLEILREAIAARNGWRRILARCAPPRVPRRSSGVRVVDRGANWETSGP